MHVRLYLRKSLLFRYAVVNQKPKQQAKQPPVVQAIYDSGEKHVSHSFTILLWLALVLIQPVCEGPMLMR